MSAGTHQNKNPNMIQTAEATIDATGNVRLNEPIKIKGVQRALVTVNEDPPVEAFATVLLTEVSLAEDWLKLEEEQTLSDLQ